MAAPVASVGPASTGTPTYVAAAIGPLAILGSQYFLTGLVNADIQESLATSASANESGSFSINKQESINLVGKTPGLSGVSYVFLTDVNNNILGVGKETGTVLLSSNFNLQFGTSTAQNEGSLNIEPIFRVNEFGESFSVLSPVVINLENNGESIGKNTQTFSPINISFIEKVSANGIARAFGSVAIDLIISASQSAYGYMEGAVQISANLSVAAFRRFSQIINIVVEGIITEYYSINVIIDILIQSSIKLSKNIYKTIFVDVYGRIKQNKFISKLVGIVSNVLFKHEQELVSNDWNIPTIGPDPIDFGENEEPVVYPEPTTTDFDYSTQELGIPADFSEGGEPVSYPDPEYTDFDYSQTTLGNPKDTSISELE
jgi:hypothetical protein